MMYFVDVRKHSLAYASSVDKELFCYTSVLSLHFIVIINNAQLTIYVLQGFQSLLQLAEKHCSNILLFNLQLRGRKLPKE